MTLKPWRREPPRRRLWDLIKLVGIMAALTVIGVYSFRSG